MFFQCQNSVDTLKERTKKCLDQVEKVEFELAGGQKGYSHNVDLSCIIGSKLPLVSSENNLVDVFSTYDILGKKSIIHFWFIACKPCIKEIHSLNSLKEELGSHEYNFLAFSKDTNEELAVFLSKIPFDFSLFPNSEQLIKSEFGLVWGYPMTIVTDEDNIVQKTYGALSNDDISDLKVYLKKGK